MACTLIVRTFAFMFICKDVVKLQEENSSLKSGFQRLEQHTTQQTKTFEVRIWGELEPFNPPSQFSGLGIQCPALCVYDFDVCIWVLA